MTFIVELKNVMSFFVRKKLTILSILFVGIALFLGVYFLGNRNVDKSNETEYVGSFDVFIENTLNGNSVTNIGLIENVLLTKHNVDEIKDKGFKDFSKNDVEITTQGGELIRVEVTAKDKSDAQDITKKLYTILTENKDEYFSTRAVKTVEPVTVKKATDSVATMQSTTMGFPTKKLAIIVIVISFIVAIFVALITDVSTKKIRSKGYINEVTKERYEIVDLTKNKQSISELLTFYTLNLEKNAVLIIEDSELTEMKILANKIADIDERITFNETTLELGTTENQLKLLSDFQSQTFNHTDTIIVMVKKNQTDADWLKQVVNLIDIVDKQKDIIYFA